MAAPTQVNAKETEIAVPESHVQQTTPHTGPGDATEFTGSKKEGKKPMRDAPTMKELPFTNSDTVIELAESWGKAQSSRLSQRMTRPAQATTSQKPITIPEIFVHPASSEHGKCTNATTASSSTLESRPAADLADTCTMGVSTTESVSHSPNHEQGSHCDEEAMFSFVSEFQSEMDSTEDSMEPSSPVEQIQFTFRGIRDERLQKEKDELASPPGPPKKIPKPTKQEIEQEAAKWKASRARLQLRIPLLQNPDKQYCRGVWIYRNDAINLYHIRYLQAQQLQRQPYDPQGSWRKQWRRIADARAILYFQGWVQIDLSSYKGYNVTPVAREQLMKPSNRYNYPTK